MNRWAATKAARVARGMCRDCGKAPIVSGAKCDACRRVSAEAVYRWYLARREKGLCSQCDKPAMKDGKAVRCFGHAKEYAARVAARRAERKGVL